MSWVVLSIATLHAALIAALVVVLARRPKSTKAHIHIWEEYCYRLGSKTRDWHAKVTHENGEWSYTAQDSDYRHMLREALIVATALEHGLPGWEGIPNPARSYGAEHPRQRPPQGAKTHYCGDAT